MLNRQTYFIRGHVGILKLTDTYDILDPDTQEQLAIATEKPGSMIRILRLLIKRQLLPSEVFVYQGSNLDNGADLLFSIRRGVGLFGTRVNILDDSGQVVGWLKSKSFSLGFNSKLFSLGRAFRVFDSYDNEIALVQGDWREREFRFLDPGGNEIGTISQRWAGLAQELFASPGHYVIHLNEQPSAGKAILLLAAGLAIDTVFK